MANEAYFTGLDVGTDHIRCVIGTDDQNGKLKIVGYGSSASKGLRKGIVSSTDTVAESIRKAVADAEKVSGIEINDATVNVTGEHIIGENKSGVVAVTGVDKQIEEDDIERAIDSASAMPMQAGWELIARLPQEFIVDGQDGIIEPIGMIGSRLEARVHVVSSPGAGRQNLIKAVRKAGIDVEETVIDPLAAAEAVLTDDDKEYGCALVNMGAEMTSVIIYGRGAVRHIAFLPFGSMHFTKDLAVALRVSIPQADQIKRDFGCAAPYLLTDDERNEVIEVVPVGRSETRTLSKEILCDILQPRAVELLQHVARETNSAGAQLSSGVVLTGGGTMLRGLSELAEQIFDAPTRHGFLDRDLFGGLIDQIQTPEWATSAGLAYHSMRSHMRYGGEERSTVQRVAEWFGGIREKLK